ncbi:hypothetical protein HFU84_08640 [Acidithiobacillus sp. CV18-2]|nr:hypothetical protein [Acidithiobacillus sp. CV18-3]MBU2756959.1 hypothetical protein [Acidithiobacillus sp. BN09-2]MBU2777570.1 hypothetical protein [Acidithiobacillus sp. CV18-2]MBU2799670.1 hypothetical protein [Acidithiobacillus sp. VAN18-4]
MANLQHIAERIFRHVDAGHLVAGYASAMGFVLDRYDDDPDFHDWVQRSPGSDVEKLLACMVKSAAWNNEEWLANYLSARIRGAA